MQKSKKSSECLKNGGPQGVFASEVILPPSHMSWRATRPIYHLYLKAFILIYEPIYVNLAPGA